MIRLIKFELYKIFTKKSLIIGLVSIILIYGFVSFQEYQMAKEYGYEGEEFKEFRGLLTVEKVILAEERYQEIQNRTIKHTEPDGTTLEEFRPEDQKLAGLYESVSWAQGNQQVKEDRINRLIKKIEKLEQENMSNYNYRKTKLEYDMLKKLPKVGIYNEISWVNMINYFSNKAFLYSGILILLGLTSVFTEEYSTKMDRLILSSKNGKNKIITSKIIASVIYISIISIVLSTINLIFSIILYGTENLNVSIQNSSSFLKTPYNLTIVQFYGIQALINFIAILSFGLLVLAISSISKEVIIPFFIGIMIYLVPIPMYSKLDETWMKPWGDIIRHFNYSVIAQVQYLFDEFKTLNLFGQPILYPYAAIAIMIILGVLSIIFTYISFRRHQVKS